MGGSVNPSGLGLPAEADFEHDNQIVIAHSYAITPNLINELRGGISRGQHGGDFPLDGPAFMQELGLNPNQLGPFPARRFPRFCLRTQGRTRRHCSHPARSAAFPQLPDQREPDLDQGEAHHEVWL